MRHNDATNMTPTRDYMRHFQIFGKISVDYIFEKLINLHIILG